MTDSGVERPAIRGIYHLFLGNTMSFLTLAISSIVVGRLLGPQLYGLYGLALVVPGYLTSAIHFNITDAATRYCAKYTSEGDREKAVSFGYSLLLLQLLLALTAFTISLPFSGFLSHYLLRRPGIAGYIPFASASVLGVAMMNVSSGTFQGLGEMRKSAIANVVQAVTRLVVSVVLILIGLSALGAVIGYTASYIIGGVSGLAFLLYSYRRIFPTGFFSSALTGLRYGLPLYLGAAPLVIVSPYSSTLLAHFASNQQLGGYFAALNLGTAFALFSTPISKALFPMFSKLDRKSTDLSTAYYNSLKYGCVILVPILFAMIALAAPLTSIVYGNKYEFAGLYLMAFSSTSLVIGLGSFGQSALLLGIGEIKKSVRIDLIAVLVGLASMTIFVPLFNVYGLALSMTCEGLASTLGGMRAIRPIVGRYVAIRSVSRIYLASAITSGVVYSTVRLRLPALMAVFVGLSLFIILYILLLALMRALTQEEISTLEGYFDNAGLLSIPLKVLARYYRAIVKVIEKREDKA